MTTKNQYYQESGNVNILRFSIFSIIAFFIVVILAYCYSVLSISMPIVYINIFLPFGLTIALAYLVKLLIRLSHNRNRKLIIGQAILIGLFANYFQWSEFLLFAVNENVSTLTEYIANTSWLISKNNGFGLISAINQYGMWEIFGIQLNGFALTSIWIIEFLLIMIGPILASIKTKPYPYSENGEKWYSKYTLNDDFASISTENKVIDGLKTNPISALESLGKGTATRYTKVHMFFEEDELTQYITFEKVFIADKRKDKKDIDIIVNNFSIDKSDALEIMNKYAYNKEKVAII